MKKILFLVIILMFAATIADAKVGSRYTQNIDRAALMDAAKASLSADGVKILKHILAKTKEADLDFISFKPALCPDLKRNNAEGVKKFLKIISDWKVATGKKTVSGMSADAIERSKFSVIYSLEETPPEYAVGLDRFAVYALICCLEKAELCGKRFAFDKAWVGPVMSVKSGKRYYIKGLKAPFEQGNDSVPKK
jgi:hypothetical protein